MDGASWPTGFLRILAWIERLAILSPSVRRNICVAWPGKGRPRPSWRWSSARGALSRIRRSQSLRRLRRRIVCGNRPVEIQGTGGQGWLCQINLRRLDGRLGILRVVDAGQLLEGIVK